jgi:dipeptidyl aminopeptidase/acylaminoacyl peptidase
MSFDPRLGVDYTVIDPPFLDNEFPPEQFVTTFESGGSTIHATMWIAAGPEPKPCVVVSPQVFGGDRLESIIIPLMASGIHVCTFHPRGMWDGKHEFSFVSALDDLLAAVEAMRNSGADDRRTTMGKPYRIDPTRIAVTGVSGGGGSLSIAACAEDPKLPAAIAIAPGNFDLNRDPAGMAAGKALFDAMKARTNGRVDLESWLSSMGPAEYDRISPITQAKNLTGKKLLLIGGERDVVTPIEFCHRPIAAAMREAKIEGFSEVILETDHMFLTKRIALARLIIAWLRSECGF